MKEERDVRYRIEKFPPEGGFGYIVMLAIALPVGFCWGIFMVFGLLFKDLLESIDAGTSAVTIIMGFLNISLSLSALFTGSINRITSIRFTALLGGVCFFVGSLLCVFATSVEHLIISYGVCLGAGMGFIIPSSYSTFNDYFVEKRVIMMSILQSIIGLVMVSYPILVQFLLNEFGLRGALAVIAALNGNAVVGMLLMHPVEWHYKVLKVRIEDEAKPFINTDFKENVEMRIVTSEDELKAHDNILNDVLIKEVLDGNKELIDSNTMNILNDAKQSSVISSDNHRTIKTGKWQKIVDFLDLTLLTDFIYLNILLGMFLVSFSDDYFLTLQPLYLIDLNISKDDTAFILAIAAGFDVGSRILLSVVSVFFSVNARYLYSVGVLASIVSRIAFVCVFDFKGLAIISAIIGSLRTFIHVTKPLVVARHLPKEKFASGYGLLMFLQGVLTFLLGPFIGWTRDVTGSYVICFNILSMMMGLCVVMWLIEFIWCRIRPRKTGGNEKPELE